MATLDSPASLDTRVSADQAFPVTPVTQVSVAIVAIRVLVEYLDTAVSVVYLGIRGLVAPD